MMTRPARAVTAVRRMCNPTPPPQPTPHTHRPFLLLPFLFRRLQLPSITSFYHFISLWTVTRVAHHACQHCHLHAMSSTKSSIIRIFVQPAAHVSACHAIQTAAHDNRSCPSVRPRSHTAFDAPSQTFCHALPCHAPMNVSHLEETMIHHVQ